MCYSVPWHWPLHSRYSYSRQEWPRDEAASDIPDPRAAVLPYPGETSWEVSSCDPQQLPDNRILPRERTYRLRCRIPWTFLDCKTKTISVRFQSLLFYYRIAQRKTLFFLTVKYFNSLFPDIQFLFSISYFSNHLLLCSSFKLIYSVYYIIYVISYDNIIFIFIIFYYCLLLLSSLIYFYLCIILLYRIYICIYIYFRNTYASREND